MKKKVLFACNMNSVRSPMAAALMRKSVNAGFEIDSAGVYEGELDPFAEIVMEEIGAKLNGHAPKTMGDLKIEDFDIVIALTPESAAAARRFLPNSCIEFWDVENPSEARGGREEILDSYRYVRDRLESHIKARFPEIYEKP